MSLLKVENLSFHYDDYKVLDEISFVVNKGSFVAIVGANGAGKSTLLKLLLGELHPSMGSVTWNQDFTNFSYISQDVTGIGFLASVMEVLLSNLYVSKRLFSFYNKSDKLRVMEVLDLVGLSGSEDRLISELSGGQIQRVMLARALVNNPKVLIMDEPTSGVDKVTSIALYSLLKELCSSSELSVLLVTHDIDTIVEYADVVLKVEDGKVGYNNA